MLRYVSNTCSYFSTEEKMADIPTKANLEDLSAMVEMMTGKKLADVLGTAGRLADCSGHCGCHVRYCTCHGSVSSLSAGQEVINPADFLEMRDQQINDLKKRLEDLSKPLG
jgi:hypothetical protein